jgi:antirestriction protein ArdC
MQTDSSDDEIRIPGDVTAYRAQCRDQDRRGDLLRATIETWLEELQQDVDTATASEQFETWLTTQAQFHEYSFRNSVLIRRQCPAATRVAGYRTWQEFGRQVRSGEQAIWIRAPVKTRVCPSCGMAVRSHDDCPERSPVDEWPHRVVGFRSVAVFDISQTDGDPLPQLDREASGEATWLLDALERLADDWALSVRIIPQAEWPHGSAWGVYGPVDERIDLRDRENRADLARTFLHELAHARLHPEESVDSRQAAAFELDAEATAAIVGRHFGLDTSGSRWYLSAWSHDEAVSLADRCEQISRTARDLIERIEALTSATAAHEG